jgi:hypothetical protein
MHQPKGSELPCADLLELRRWNAQTIYDGWEQIAMHDDDCGSASQLGYVHRTGTQLFDAECQQSSRNAEVRFNRRGKLR